MITLSFFQLKWLERLILYHIMENNNVQAKLSAPQYGFRAGVSTETASPKFVRRVEHCLVRKKPALGIFLNIVDAFDNVLVAVKSVTASCQIIRKLLCNINYSVQLH